MCGFITYFRRAGGPLGSSLTARLEQGWRSLTHRGPDDGGIESGEDGWWMGFRRLSILDLSEHGHQPMRFGQHQVLTFNGEIYNFQALRERHQLSGLQSSGDTAVLGTLLQRGQEKGEEPGRVLSELRGMFAFCWWDAEKRRLVAARDHFGIKPLYYLELPGEGGGIAFASEAGALRPLLAEAGAVSPTALAQYFRWGSVRGPGTIFPEIRLLPAGGMMEWQEGAGRVSTWFQPCWGGNGNGSKLITDPAAAAEETRAVVSESIQAHLISDVPVGVFLSGGLDSNLVTAAMRAAGVNDIVAFSIGYGDGAGVACETDAARRSAEFFGAKFHAEQVSAQGLSDAFDHYIGHLDQPSGDAFNTYLVSRLAAKQVKVALSGLGADEWFGGYNYMRLMHLVMSLPGWTRGPRRAVAPVASALHGLLPKDWQGRRALKAAAYLAGAYGVDLFQLHAKARAIEDERRVRDLLLSEELTANDLAAQVPADWRARGGEEWLHQLFALETEAYLQPTLLRDNDAMSMAHSLELRVPLVDREVQALSARLHPDLMLNARGGKRVLREAFREQLPPWIYDDRQKKTFTLPMMKWLRETCWRDRLRDTLSPEAVRRRGWLRPAAVERALRDFENSTTETKAGWRLSQLVWQIFVLEAWAARKHDT